MKDISRIDVTTIDLNDVTWRALAALRAWNASAPYLFIRAGELVRVEEDEDGRPVIGRLDEFAVRYELARCVDWVKVRTVKKMVEDVIVPPPMDVVRDLLRSPVIEFGLPALKGVIETPTMRPDGSILDANGYDTATGLFYAPSPGLSIPRLPDAPTEDQVQAARDLLLEVVCDFPFVDQAARANTIATMISPVIRPLITGPVPLALFDKPAAGTGASLLAEVVAEVVQGRDAAMMTAPEEEGEWRKRVLAQLLAGRGVVVVDNIEGKLQSATLAALLTSMTYEDRILGKSEMLVLPHRCVWIGTGINIQLAGDLPRRCYWIRMDANSARPWQRDTEFKHPNLKAWVRDVRGAVIAAILILARAWVQAGRPVPAGNPVVGGFESWAQTLGGILDYAGIPGFLGNLDEMYTEADSDGPQWAAFVERWYEIWKDQPKTVSQIVDYMRMEGGTCDLDDQLMSVVPDEVVESWSKPGASFARKLGDCLRHRNGKIFPNGFRLHKTGTAHKTAVWVISKVKP